MLGKMSANLKARLKISSLAVPVMLLIIYLSSFPAFMPLFTLLIAAIIAASLWEYYKLAEAKGIHPLSLLGIGMSVIYTTTLFLYSQSHITFLGPLLIFGIFLFTAFGFALFRGATPLVTLAITSFGFVYLTIPLSFLILINFFFSQENIQDGRWWLLYLFTTTKMTDTVAFILGKLCGKTALAPEISPKKTLEGAFGGLLGGVMTSVFFVLILEFFFHQPPLTMTLLQSIFIGTVLALLAQFGDLAESLLKRDAGVKDSSHIPGLGGILDTVDSLVFAAPCLYLFMYSTQ